MRLRGMGLAALALLLVQPLEARRTRRPARVRAVKVVLPVAAETIVQARITAALIALAGRPEDWLDEPFIVAAVYYRDEFLDRYAGDESARRVVCAIRQQMTTADRLRFLRAMAALYRDAEPEAAPATLVPPVREGLSSRRRRSTHRDAVDLFAPEGTPVVAAAPGVVLQAEDGWDPADPLSTSSPRGGNSVIVYEPERQRLYRYCHLDQVRVAPGMVIAAGETIGTVGHTGANAARPGHGRHLHFEINQLEGETVRTVSADELRRMLKQAIALAQTGR